MTQDMLEHVGQASAQKILGGAEKARRDSGEVGCAPSADKPLSIVLLNYFEERTDYLPSKDPAARDAGWARCCWNAGVAASA